MSRGHLANGSQPAQGRDGLALLPLDKVLEQVGQPPAAGDAGDVSNPAAGPDRDDEPLVMEGEHLQRPALQLRVQVRATVSPSSSATCASRHRSGAHSGSCQVPSSMINSRGELKPTSAT
jgi:hypothetical protein